MPQSRHKRNLMPHADGTDNVQPGHSHHTLGTRILVVEDARDIARLLDMHLHDEGYQVEVAFDGLQGWEKLQEVRYDLVILDLMLPGVDGLELCRRLRAQQGADGAYTPVLMLTSKGTELDRVLGQAGCGTVRIVQARFTRNGAGLGRVFACGTGAGRGAAVPTRRAESGRAA